MPRHRYLTADVFTDEMAKNGYDVITVPELRAVKFRITPPAYTRRPASDSSG